jgi:hypothetical protein
MIIIPQSLAAVRALTLQLYERGKLAPGAKFGRKVSLMDSGHPWKSETETA